MAIGDDAPYSLEMVAASIAFVVVAGVAIVGAVISLLLLLAKRKAHDDG